MKQRMIPVLHRPILLILCFTMLLSWVSCFGVPTFAATEGTTGDCTWTLDGTVLTIAGNGSMGNGGVVQWGDQITEVIIGQGVTDIADYAFYGCKNLSAATIANSVAQIGSEAFRDCTALTGITIPGSVKQMGYMNFYGCTALKNVIIENGVQKIGEYAFENCTALESVTIPESVTQICNNAFRRCYKLASVSLPAGVTTIGLYAFNSCTSLTQIFIPKKVTEIGEWAFSQCSSLESITAESGNSVFHSAGNCLIHTASGKLLYGCKNSVIPTDGSIKSIEGSAFARSEIEEVVVPNGVKTIGEGAFYSCAKLKSVIFSMGLESVADGAFLNCTSLSSVAIPSSVTSIGWVSFGFYCEEYNMFGGDPIDGFVIYGTTDSEAWRYADKNGFKFVDPNRPYRDAAQQFRDVGTKDWFYKSGAINFVLNADLFGGVSDTEFAPNTNMTRGMFVTVLGRLAGANSRTQRTKFKDVKTPAYYSGYIKWASEKGIVSGTSPTTFAPNESVTREQICKMMVEYCNVMQIPLQKVNAEIRFADADKISGWAKRYVKTCQTAGLVGGSKQNGKVYFNPGGNATRAEVAQILYNFAVIISA